MCDPPTKEPGLLPVRVIVLVRQIYIEPVIVEALKFTPQVSMLEKPIVLLVAVVVVFVTVGPETLDGA